MNLIKKFYNGELILPILAICFVAYAIGQQVLDGFRSITINYTIGLGMVVVITSIIIIFNVMKDKEEKRGKSTTSIDKRMVIFILSIIILISILEFVGYFIGFFIFFVFALWLVGKKNILRNFVFSIITVSIIHIIFVILLGMSLPTGILI